MDIIIHNHYTYDDSKIIAKLDSITLKLKHMATDLTALTAAVAKDTEVDESAITLLNGLKAALDAAGTDPVALKALSDQIGANTDKLAAAVAANTPSA